MKEEERRGREDKGRGEERKGRKRRRGKVIKEGEGGGEK